MGRGPSRALSLPPTKAAAYPCFQEACASGGPREGRRCSSVTCPGPEDKTPVLAAVPLSSAAGNRFQAPQQTVLIGPQRSPF